MAWHGALLGLGRPLADGDRIDDLSSPLLVVPPLAWRICRAVRRCAISSFFSDEAEL